MGKTKERKTFGQYLLDGANWIGNAISTPAQTSAKNAQLIMNTVAPNYASKNDSNSVKAPISNKVETNHVPILSSGASTDTSAVDDANKAYEKYLNDEKTSAETAASKQYATDVTDAERRYERSRADYGAQAEKLRELGIDTSGYANYLGDRAYAQMVSEIQAAKGRQADAMQAAEKNYNDAYAEYLLNKSVQEETIKAEKEAQAGDEKATLEAAVTGKYLFGNEGGAYDSLDEAKKKLENVLTTFGEGTSQYIDALDEFDKKYGIRVDSDYLNGSDDKSSVIGITKDELENTENGKKMTVWNGSEKIKVKKGGVQSGDVVNAFNGSALAAQAKETPIVFAYRGAVYIGYNGQVYAIEVGEKEYDTLLGYLTDNTVSSVYK